MDYPIACDLCSKKTKPEDKTVYLIKVREVQAGNISGSKYITLCADCYSGTAIYKILHKREVQK